MVPQKSARGIQRGVRPGAAAGRDPSDPPAASHWASPRALSMGRALRSVSRRRLAPLLRVARPSGRASGGGGELLGDRGTAVRFEAARPRGGVRLAGTGQPCPPTALLCWIGLAGRAWGQWRVCRPTTRPVLKHGPRSLTCARVIGLYETQRRSESEGRPGLTQVGSFCFAQEAHHRPVPSASSVGRS